MSATFANRLLVAVATLGCVLFLVAIYLVLRLTSDKAVAYPNIEDHFRYGSTGGERTSGIPYSIWKSLPMLFPDKLPGGYRSLGFVYENGKDLPIGTSKRRFKGIDLVFFNCAICHVGQVRKDPGSAPYAVLGMPSNTVDLERFFAFLFAIAPDPRFTPARILQQIRNDGNNEDLINRLLFRFYLIDLIREQLLDKKSRLQFITEQPQFGPGRIDTFNPAKALLNFRQDKLREDEKTGVADLPSIWYQRQRQGLKLHWDGNNTKVEERNRSAAFGTGATPPTLDRPNMKRVEDWLFDTAKPKPFADLFPIDQALADQGKPTYDRYCSNCHGLSGVNFRNGRVGQVVDISNINTDRHRLDSYTRELAVSQNMLYTGYGDERFSNFRKTNGYSNMPLDGIWLRAPYLHNGSVPTLRDLLNDSAERPKTFYRGDDVYDPATLGFVSNVSERNGRKFFFLDVNVPGNGNQGHEGEAYGTTLSSAEKTALVEYLKTF